MSVVNSPEGVCNLALDLLRHNVQVTDISVDPKTEEEAIGARWYDSIRRAIIRMFPWNFARTRSTLNRLTAAPAFGYSDAYQLPNDYLGLLFIGEDPEEFEGVDFQIESGKLLIDNDGATSLDICYVQDVTDVGRFDPIFLMLFAAELAIVFANAIVGLQKGIKTIEPIRDRWEVKARSKNGHENPPRVLFTSKLLSAKKRAGMSNSTDGQHLFS